MPYANGSLENSAKNTVIGSYLALIMQCSVTNQTQKVASNHHGGTKLEVSQGTKVFFFFFSFLRRPISRVP